MWHTWVIPRIQIINTWILRITAVDFRVTVDVLRITAVDFGVTVDVLRIAAVDFGVTVDVLRIAAVDFGVTVDIRRIAAFDFGVTVDVLRIAAVDSGSLSTFSGSLGPTLLVYFSSVSAVYGYWYYILVVNIAQILHVYILCTTFYETEQLPTTYILNVQVDILTNAITGLLLL